MQIRPEAIPERYTPEGVDTLLLLGPHQNWRQSTAEQCCRECWHQSAAPEQVARRRADKPEHDKARARVVAAVKEGRVAAGLAGHVGHALLESGQPLGVKGAHLLTFSDGSFMNVHSGTQHIANAGRRVIPSPPAVFRGGASIRTFSMRAQ